MSKLVYRGVEYLSRAPHFEGGFIHYCLNQKAKKETADKEKNRDKDQNSCKELIV